MGMDLGRGSGGRAPFLVVGLLLICFFLVFNWWSLSSENFELYHQLEEEAAHLKIGSRKVLECNELKQELEKELSLVKQSVLDKNGNIEELKANLQKLKEERDQKAESFTHCNIELESQKSVRLSQDALIASRREEKNQLESELKDKKAEIIRLEAELKEAQEKLKKAAPQRDSIAAAAAKEENNPVNHEGRNEADRAEADGNNARELTEDNDKETENNIDDPREKEQEREAGDIKNTVDAPQS